MEAARIDWSQPGVPVSARHGDVYFAAADGLEESRHVFLAGNDLPDAWRNRNLFTIGETGFGTGLNFLAVWDLWQRTAPSSARLHFVSVEGFPLTVPDLERAHHPFPELAPLARRLRAAWPHLYAGFHRLHFDDDRVTLTLLLGEAGDMLNALDAQADAWFLDGFSPAKNPDLWRQEILNRIGALTRRGGTASSFTVAGDVRRGMELAGFHVEKTPGFGRKRHMLRAHRTRGAPAHSSRFPSYVQATSVPATALIVGAGIAGSAAAQALIRRNVEVTLIDPNPDLLYAASGNPVGLANPKPTADSSPAGRFHCAAFDYAERNVFRTSPDIFHPCGVLELAIDARGQRRFEAFASGHVLPASALQTVTAAEASQLAGVPLPAAAIHFPHGGVVMPRACAALLRGALRPETGRVIQLQPTARGWTAELDSGAAVSADIAVLACGNDSVSFGATGVPVTASRGQLSLVPVTPGSAALAKALSFGGYVSPPVEGRHVLGATYDDVGWPFNPETSAVLQSDHERNYRTLVNALPEFPFSRPPADWRGHVAFRCTTPDRLPVCGPVPHLAAPLPNPVDEKRNHPMNREFHGSYKEGMFLYAGLGSHGLSTAPLLGELLASVICGDPLPTERVVTDLLHPARFLIRSLRKAGISAHL